MDLKKKVESKAAELTARTLTLCSAVYVDAATWSIMRWQMIQTPWSGWI